MALLDSEGFGWTTTLSDLVTYGAFYSASGSGAGTSIVTGGPLGDNYCNLQSSFSIGQGALVRLLPTTNMATIYTGCRYNCFGNTNNEYSGISFLDSSLACQFTISVNPTTLQIQVYRGTPWSGGTLLGSSAIGVFPLTGWFYLEVYLLIASGTGGAVTVRINNVAVLTLTGQNTQATANAGAARIVLGQTGAPLGYGNGGASSGIAHWYLCDGTGSAPWNTFLGDVRVQTLVPTSNATVQFTPSISTLTITTGTPSGTYSYSTGNVVYTKIIPTSSGTLQTLEAYLSSGSPSHAKMGIYSDSGGPNTLLATSAVVTSFTTASTIQFTVSAGPTLFAGTAYWVAFVSDTSATWGQNGSPGTNYGTSQTLSYASAFSSSVSGLALGNGWLWCGVIVNPSNWGIAATVPPAPSTTYNSDATVSNQDTFNCASVAASTSAVYGVHVKGIYLKSDSGSRSIENVLVSGGTTATGASTTLGTSAAQVRTMFETDPNTSAQWTTAAANAAQPGYNVSA